jgi:CHASE2 domain-containing sensor protein
MGPKVVTLSLDGDLQRQGFRVTVEIGPEGHPADAVTTGTLPAAPNLHHDLHAWQQRYRQLDTPTRIRPKEIVYIGSIQQVEACQHMAQTLRRQFNRWLGAASFHPVDRLLREELMTTDVIRLVVRTANADLHQVPWHLWDLVDHYPQTEVVLGAPHFKRPLTLAPATSAKVNVLAILGHSAGIDVNQDRALLEALPHANVTFLVEPQRQSITDQLWERPWDILFFAGHSETQETTGRIFINPQESLTLEELKYGLRQAVSQGLKLAIFNSCDGLGLTDALEHLNLPQMIVMRQPVPDRIAQLFLTYLLPAYAAGQPLPQALRQARERLQGVEGEFPCASWLPILYQATPDAPPTWEQLRRPATLAPLPATDRPHQERWRPALVASLVASVLMLALRALGSLQAWELQAYDRLLQQRLPQAMPERILIVEATEKDINRYGYPLPDAVLAQAIDRLRPYKPRLIGLDIFRDRINSNSRLQRQITEQENLIALCSVRIGQGNNASGIAPPPQVPAERLGFSNVLEDPDGVMRRHLLFVEPNLDDPCDTSFSLGALLALHYLEAEGIAPKTLPNQHLQLGKAEFAPLDRHAGPYRNLDDKGFQVWLNYTHPETFVKRVPLSELLDEGFFIESLEDHIVLIGMSAPVSNPTDYFLTPAGAHQWPRQRIPGVMLQAQMVNHLLAAALTGQSPITTWSEWGEMLWIIGWCSLGGGLIGWRYQRLSMVALASGVAILGLYGVAWGFLQIGLWVPLVPAAGGLVLASGGTAVGSRLLGSQG